MNIMVVYNKNAYNLKKEKLKVEFFESYGKIPNDTIAAARVIFNIKTMYFYKNQYAVGIDK